MKLRKSILSLHRYVGILAGILLIIISLTGSLLVFHEEIDQFFNPQLLRVTPQNISPKYC
ncbi:PepSY domain-containing protein [Nostoc sp. NZL]|uniref:PepSY domain-containing protein n=1 Tax=Nostoc sp. NZL TaxID=2650612 RepID=UPI0018C53C5B|nr:PepSY domain-containing protein [Nostoc sp. NZL]MBG1241452.1 PepSY domain-containing protein [Nostoc sp. NZL]